MRQQGRSSQTTPVERYKGLSRTSWIGLAYPNACAKVGMTSTG
jgi:hypothetical protein